MGDDRPARYQEGGITVYRASALGLCDRIFMALAQDFSPMAHPQWFQDVLDEGTAMEQHILNAVEEKFDTAIGHQQRVMTLHITDDIIVRGAIDGMAYLGSSKNLSIIDAKKFRESTWLKWKRQGVECQPTYPWQMSAYMHAWKEESGEDADMLMVGGLFDGNGITDTYEHLLAQPPIPLKAIVKRVLMLESRIESGRHPMDQPCTSKTYPCPFYYLHDEDDKPEPEALVGSEELKRVVTERNRLAEEAATLGKRVREIEKQAKELNKEIEAQLKKAQVDDDEMRTIDTDDGPVEVKYHNIYRKGYTVEESEYVKVTVKKKAETPGKGRTRKLAPKEDNK